MDTRQADRIIRAAKPVTLYNEEWRETMRNVIVIRRDRWNLYTSTGGVFDRGELELVKGCMDRQAQTLEEFTRPCPEQKKNSGRQPERGGPND